MRSIKFSVAALSLMFCVACSDSSSTPSAVAPAGGPGVAASQQEVAVLLQRGIDQGEKGDLANAEKTFRSLLDIDAKNKYGWYNLGVLQQQRKKDAQAAASYDKALAADPGFTPAMYNKAIIVEVKDQAAAMRLYKQIVVLNPKASTTYLRMGLLQLRRGETDSAKDSFSKAVAIDPELRGSVPEQYRPVGP
jgi:Tfp pilus assembly protein PilF